MVKLIATNKAYASHSDGHNESPPAPEVDFPLLGSEIYGLSNHSLLVLPSELRREYFRVMLKYSNNRKLAGSSGSIRHLRGAGRRRAVLSKSQDDESDDSEDVDGSSEASSSLDVDCVDEHERSLLMGGTNGTSNGAGGAATVVDPLRSAGQAWDRVQRHVLRRPVSLAIAVGSKRSRELSTRTLKPNRTTLEDRVAASVAYLQANSKHHSAAGDLGGTHHAHSGGVKLEDDASSSTLPRDVEDPLLQAYYFPPTLVPNEGGGKPLSETTRRLMLGLSIPFPPVENAGAHQAVMDSKKGVGSKGAGAPPKGTGAKALGNCGGGGGVVGDSPSVLLSVLDQCETLPGADIFRHRVDVGTIMNHSGAQLGPYSAVVKVPMCLEAIREAIVNNVSIRQVVGAAQKGHTLQQQLKNEGSAIKKETDGGGDQGATSSHPLPPQLFDKQSVSKLSISPNATGTPTTFTITTLGDIRRCVWLIAANCSAFNAPEGPFPEKGRQFARRCSAVIDERAMRVAHDYLEERGL